MRKKSSNERKKGGGMADGWMDGGGYDGDGWYQWRVVRAGAAGACLLACVPSIIHPSIHPLSD